MSSSARFNCFVQNDLRLQFCSEAKLLSHRLQFVVRGLPHLDFHLVAHAEFVLDVLRATKAAEDSTSDHDAEFGGECLCFFHGVSSKDDG